MDKFGQMLDNLFGPLSQAPLVILVPVILSAWHIKLAIRDCLLLKFKN